MTKTKEAPATEPETSTEITAPATEPETSTEITAPATEPETSTEITAPATSPENPGATVSPEADAAPEVTETQLRALLVKVETGNNDMQRAALIEDLTGNDGATIAPDASTMTLAGVEVTTPTDHPRLLLENWCNAARRKIMSGELPA